MQAIFTITGGGWLADTLNAVAAFTASATWGTLLKWAGILSVVAVVWSWVQRRNIFTLLKWLAMIILVPGVLVVGKTSVQVIDITDPTGVYAVDNVPVGLALPASLLTAVGYGMTAAFDDLFHRPDAVTYSRTGLLFGAELLSTSADFTFADGDVSGQFSDYVQNCVIGDIFLNHKYSMEDLMNSPDPYGLIFSRPSPLRGVFDKGGNFLTCQQEATILQKAIGNEVTDGHGKTYTFWVRKLFGTGVKSDALMATLLSGSYDYFYGGGRSAADIMRQNVVMNGLRQGISAYAARNGDAAGLLNIATAMETEKQTLQQTVGARVGMRYLPMMQTILFGLLLALFPVIVMLAISSLLTWTVLKNYLLAMASLQMWPLLFAILNNAMMFFMKSAGGYEMTLSNLSQIQQQHSMMASTAGWLSIMIPPMSWMIMKGLGSVAVQAGGNLVGMMQGGTAHVSSQVADGSYALDNMQTDNVQGSKWDTNSTWASGRMDRQLANGAMAGTTQDGTTIMTASQSKLPIDMNFGRSVGMTAQRLARESQVQAETALHGANHAMNSAYSQAKQFSAQHGNSDTLGQHTDNSQTAQASKSLDAMQSAAHDYATRHGISEQDAWAEIESKSRQGEAEAHAGVSAGNSAVGKLAKLTFGVDAGTSGKLSASSGSQSTVDQRQTGSTDHTRSADAKDMRDFKAGMQTLQSYRATHSADHNDNSSASQLEQIGTTLSVADSQYQQYTNSLSRSHEYSRMASLSESETAQQNSNLSQEFEGYVEKLAPAEAERILTNASDENVRHEREALADRFVEEKLRARIEGDFDQSRATLGSDMATVSPATGSPGQAVSDGNEEIARRAQGAGIQGDQHQAVSAEHAQDQQHIQQTSGKIEQGHKSLQQEGDKLKVEQSKAHKEFADSYNNASLHQDALDLKDKDGNVSILNGRNPGNIANEAKRMKEGKE
ncbi:conjugal transfer mating-pair stabilization protein TraG [Cedecea sp. NFIX57]|uniref:conjugal transfer mating-pair stabilization protein TraG n=1 Tax=Cedecea sp. NFIX57 TaxID=1566286 RepID=UPI000A0C7ADD|nr:conjugal transfer mating-pair stabilization protein TraG [Cedecea sp. NFIX57]SMG60297.1 conjugal transfer mating pair stabilization protein TraG [Cedecea sp. NFIX57]